MKFSPASIGQLLRLSRLGTILVVFACVTSVCEAQTQGPVRITLDEALQLALQHNHNLLAARTTIQQLSLIHI